MKPYLDFSLIPLLTAFGFIINTAINAELGIYGSIITFVLFTLIPTGCGFFYGYCVAENKAEEK